jgi:hypothetical protein
MPQFPQITSNLSTANFRASVLTQLAAGIPVTIAGSSGATDYELVVSTYTCKNAFTGASVGDIITETQVIAITNGVASTFLTIWRNQTTAADLASAPSSANISLNGATALTDAQLRASAVPVSLSAGTNFIGSVNPDTSGSGSVTTSTPLVVTVTNFGTLGFQSDAVATGTVTIEASVDGTNYTATTYTALTTGNTSSSFNAATATIGQIDCSAFRSIRFRSNTIVGTVGITYNLSTKVSNIMLDNPLPAGTNVIGGVTLAKAASAARSVFNASSDTQIVAASTTRPEFAIYNVGPAILYIGQGSTAVTTSNFTYLLNAGDTYIANPNEVGLEHRGSFFVTGSTAQVTIGA